MSTVLCSLGQEDLESEDRVIPGVVATCSRCDHQSVSFGTGEASIRRCLALLREECPLGQHNFYVNEDC